MMRRHTKRVMVGDVAIGGDAPITVQSMTNTDTRDVEATRAQIARLEAAGCQIVRLSVYDEDCVRALPDIRRAAHVPLVADVHFDYRLAMGAVEAGVDKLRINPGNIGGADRVRELVACCRDHGAPIRIGVNVGSLHKDLLAKYGRPTAEALVESAMEHVHILEDAGFDQIVIAVKSSSVAQTVEAYRLLSQACDYPLHIGVTETGEPEMGRIKSSIGIGALLLDGIGDTLRVSLTADPVREVELGIDILRAVGLRRDRVEIISCPTCGRCRIDVPGIVRDVGKRLEHVDRPYKVAIMGCVVNGPGEAREADFGIAGGQGAAAFFKKGEAARRVEGEDMVDLLVDEVLKRMEAEG